MATITGLIAKEEVVSTFSVLYPGNLTTNIQGTYTAIAAYSFMIFNLLCAPCFAAIGYMCGFAYVAALIVYQIGGLLTGAVTLNVFTIVALLLLAGLLYLLFRPAAKASEGVGLRSTEAARV